MNEKNRIDYRTTPKKQYNILSSVCMIALLFAIGGLVIIVSNLFTNVLPVAGRLAALFIMLALCVLLSWYLSFFISSSLLDRKEWAVFDDSGVTFYRKQETQQILYQDIMLFNTHLYTPSSSGNRPDIDQAMGILSIEYTLYSGVPEVVGKRVHLATPIIVLQSSVKEGWELHPFKKALKVNPTKPEYSLDVVMEELKRRCLDSNGCCSFAENLSDGSIILD